MPDTISAPQLYRLRDDAVYAEYVEALFHPLKDFLLQKKPGHCQRLDYLPRPVMQGLGRRLTEDGDLQSAGVVCRVITDHGKGLAAWEVTGSGAVALREKATYGRIRVFCALFPAGLRLAEEDSLNVATFKTDDADSFNAKACLERHLAGKVNELHHDEGEILRAVLKHDAVKGRVIQMRLRYVLCVLGQKQLSGRSVDWEVAGAHLYELDMVPDFGLSDEIVTLQLSRNGRCSGILSDGEKSLAQNVGRLTTEAELADEAVRRNLLAYLADKDILNTREWLPPICHDPSVREALSFDVWKFTQPVTGVSVELAPLQDPAKPEKVARGLQVVGGALTNDGKKPIQIRWKVSPNDSPAVGGFRISVVRQTQDLGEVDVIPPRTVARTKRTFMVPMADNTLEDERCVACIRLEALMERGGFPIPGANDESEEFWVENGGETPPPPPDRGARIRHLDDLRFDAVYHTGKELEVRAEGWDLRRDYVFWRRLGNNARGDLHLNPVLKDVEWRILEDPASLGILHADLVNRTRSRVDDFRSVILSPATCAAAEAFHQARNAFFSQVRDLHEGTGLIEVADLHALTTEVTAYVDEYLRLLETVTEKIAIAGAAGASGINTVLADLADIARIDTVLMRVGPDDHPMDVLLLAPTHPLRVLWLFQYETLVRSWMEKMKGQDPVSIRSLINEHVLERLTTLNIPNGLAVRGGQAFINTDNYDLFWSILPKAGTDDLRTAVNATLQALGTTTPGGSLSTITPKQIADKIDRYLCHHPYVQTLKINVVNPGDGALILEAIKSLLERDLYADLNFDIKFFAPQGTRHQLIANVFDDLMTQKTVEEWSRGRAPSDTEERLLSPNTNPLFPKLIYAKHSVDALLKDREFPNRFEAHLTFIIDFFGTTLATRPHTGANRSSALHGLLAEYVTDYSAGATTSTWSRLVAPNACADLASDGMTERLHLLQDRLAHLGACIYDNSDARLNYLTVQLQLTDDDGRNHLKMLDKIHVLSDWVFTVDRNFGIEYYDDPVQGPGAGTGGYLIDYTPEFLDAVAHRLIISTYHQREIESILKTGFAKLMGGEAEYRGHIVGTLQVAQVLQVLKSVSGKLALKLINNPSQAQEVIGLALTRLALERDGRLQRAVLIPVDSHVGIFIETPKDLENADLTLKRTDLLLVRLQPGHLHVDLIEVKNRNYASPAVLVELQDAIREKNQNTESHLRYHYFGTGAQARLDAVIKHKELANILAFYFERACRHRLFTAGLTEAEAASAVKVFLEGLQDVTDGKCDVEFDHEGFIFNGASDGEIDTRSVHGNTIRIFGKLGVAKLIGLDVADDPADDDGNVGISRGTSIEPVSPQIISVPTTPIPLPEAPTEVPGLVSGPPLEPPQHITPDPGGEVATKGVSSAQSHAPEGTLPAASDAQPAVKVYLGVNETTRQSAFWDPQTTTPRRLLNQHLLIVGKSGSGKSETTKSVLYELDRLGIPTIIFDFQGEYASGPFFEAVRPQVFNVMEGLPINPFEVPLDAQSGKRRRPVEMMFQLADTLNTVFSGSGDIQLGKLREAIKECYVQAGFDMNQPAPENLQPPTLEMLRAVLDRWGADMGGQVRNLQVRLQPLFESGIFRQESASFSFNALFERTTVVLLTSGIKDLMLAASRFLLEKIYATMVMNGMSKQLKVMVCVDEAHKLCGDDKITDLVKEARKYGLGLVLSSQETRDFHPSIFANAGTQIVLALEDADAGVISRQFSTDEKERRKVKDLIMAQDSGIALVRSNHFHPYAQMRLKSFEERL